MVVNSSGIPARGSALTPFIGKLLAKTNDCRALVDLRGTATLRQVRLERTIYAIFWSTVPSTRSAPT
jgi:hypothetical protein